MKKILVAILFLLVSASLFAQTDFFSICRTGTLSQVQAALQAGARIDDRDKILILIPIKSRPPCSLFIGGIHV